MPRINSIIKNVYIFQMLLYRKMKICGYLGYLQLHFN